MRQVAASVSRQGPCFPASGPLGCAGPQSLVAKPALFPLVSRDATWLRGPGGCARRLRQGASSLNVRENPNFTPTKMVLQQPRGKSEIRMSKSETTKSNEGNPKLETKKSHHRAGREHRAREQMAPSPAGPRPVQELNLITRSHYPT